MPWQDWQPGWQRLRSLRFYRRHPRGTADKPAMNTVALDPANLRPALNAGILTAALFGRTKAAQNMLA
ncbi:MAG: hypothetical protein RJA63_1982 [Pseudomonadota bacterium]